MAAPPPPTGLPGAPPPPSSLPGASGSQRKASGTSAAPPPPAGLPGAGLSRPSAVSSAPPPLPAGFPGTATAPAPPPPPGGLPGASAARRSGGVSAAPPPPGALPVSRTGPSESGFAAPPPPVGLPSVPVRKASGAPPPPPAPGSLPGVSTASALSPQAVSGAQSPAAARAEQCASPHKAEEAADVDDDADTAADDSWKNHLEADSSDELSGSGEDSDEPVGAAEMESRRKRDMDALLRQHTQTAYQRAPARRRDEQGGMQATLTDGEATRAIDPDDSSVCASPDNRSMEQASPNGQKKKSFMSRMLFGGGSETSVDVGGTSLLNQEQDSSKFDEAWFNRWAARLSKDGLSCTKVATNGKPYERRVCVDSRNFALEIRGGRGGSTGVLLDDLVDVWLGLCSPEFSKFCHRFKKEMVPAELAKRAVVLQTPARSFSFLFASESQRDTVAQFVVYLLRSKKRGMMAGVSGAGQEPPKDGHGKVTYPNCSTYDGQFHNHMRHGTGTLTLSEGTKYESEWRNDERHGMGTELWADGTTFKGSYSKGMRSGDGVMTWPEGSKYSGQFERGRANGDGELVRTDGSIYRGKFVEDCMSGEGRMEWRDGVEYVGQFVANRREGRGTMKWTAGRWKSYEGQWKEGVQHGHGTLVDQSDQAFHGTFNRGKLERWDDDA